MSEARIHFIGTVHSDPLGAKRLERALHYERPNAIAVECSPELWGHISSGEWFEAEKRRLKKYKKLGLTNSAYKFILEELQYQNFEPIVSLEYGKKQGVPTHLTDSPKVLYEFLSHHRSPPCGNVENMNRLNRNIRQQNAETTYTDFNFSTPDTLMYEHRIANGQRNSFIDRDDYAEKKIREILADRIEKLVIVCGLAHCLHDRSRNSLFSRLQEYHPTRATLKWYDDQ